MDYEMIPAVQAVAEYMPPRRGGIFERFMEVANLLLEHEPVSAITHTIECGIQTMGMVCETRYRAKAFQAATHLEEARLWAAVEMARIQQGQAICLYIDRSFQQSLDTLERSYLDHSRQLTNYEGRMMREIDRRVEHACQSMDRRYVNTLKENEMKCAMYRDYAAKAAREGVEMQDVTFTLIKALGRNMDRYDSRAVSNICVVIQEAMRHSSAISFEEYLGMERALYERRN